MTYPCPCCGVLFDQIWDKVVHHEESTGMIHKILTFKGTEPNCTCTENDQCAKCDKCVEHCDVHNNAEVPQQEPQETS
jgi:hypothetical protein